MIVAVFVAALMVALVVAYTVQFSAATLTIGRALSDSASGTGFQDAITPPWQTNLALVGYFAVPCVIAFAWWSQGLGVAALVLVAIVAGTFVLRRLLPAPGSDYYRSLILRSMARRYADFIRSGDSVRADAMKMLLRRSGIDPEAISGA